MGIERARLNWCGWGWATHRCPDPGEEVWCWLAAEMGMPALLATPARPLAEVKLPPSALSAADVRMLSAVVGEDNVRLTDEERIFHVAGRGSVDLLRLRAGDIPNPPDAVLYPESALAVMMTLKLCESLRIAVVPFGGGTSLRQTMARQGFNAMVCLDLSRLDRVIEIDPEAGVAAAEAGISGPALEAALAERDLTLDHRPDSFEYSTLGGWIAEDTVGAGRCGRIRDALIDARIAAPCGWLHGPLAVGAGGTRGIVTEARFRVRPLARTHCEERWSFPDFAAALQAARAAHKHDAAPSGLAIADAEATRLAGSVRALVGTADAILGQFPFDGAPPAESVLARICFDGDAALVARARTVFAGIARGCGGNKRRESSAPTEATYTLPYVRDLLLDRGVGVCLFRVEASWREAEARHRTVREALHDAMRATAPRQGARGLVLGHILHAAPEGVVLGLAALYPRVLGADVAQAEAIERAAAPPPPPADALATAVDPAGILRP